MTGHEKEMHDLTAALNKLAPWVYGLIAFWALLALAWGMWA